MKKLIIILLLLLCLPAFGQFNDTEKMFGQMLNLGHFSTDGIVGFWQFIEAGDLPDESLWGHDGVITGATWAGDSLDFTANSDTVTLGTGRLGLEATQEITAIIWVKFDTLTNGDMVFSRSAFARPWAINVNANGTVVFNSRTTGVKASTTAAGAVVVGTWHMIAATFTASVQTIYIDGLFAVSDAPTGGALDFINTTTETSIGQNVLDSMDARCRSASLYNRALSASEILDLYINPDLPILDDPIWLLFSPGVAGDFIRNIGIGGATGYGIGQGIGR